MTRALPAALALEVGGIDDEALGDALSAAAGLVAADAVAHRRVGGQAQPARQIQGRAGRAAAGLAEELERLRAERGLSSAVRPGLQSQDAAAG
jgi:hypothetical protein